MIFIIFLNFDNQFPALIVLDLRSGMIPHIFGDLGCYDHHLGGQVVVKISVPNISTDRTII